MADNSKTIDNPTNFDNLSSIWILASNDENPLISYRGIVYRLNLPEKFDVKALIESRPEMFRHGAQQSRLNEWKDLMHAGKSLPSWVSEIQDRTKRTEVINNLTPDDVFRSQFRAHSGAAQSKMETIEWGLGHLERLRKVALDARAERRKKITDLIPIVSSLIALATLVISIFLSNRTLEIQRSTLDTQIALKKYELSYKPKQEAYLKYKEAEREVLDAADAHDPLALSNSITNLSSSYTALQLFLADDKSKELGLKFLDISRECEGFAKSPKDSTEGRFECYDAATQLNSRLFPSLFPKDDIPK